VDQPLDAETAAVNINSPNSKNRSSVESRIASPEGFVTKIVILIGRVVYDIGAESAIEIATEIAASLFSPPNSLFSAPNNVLSPQQRRSISGVGR